MALKLNKEHNKTNVFGDYHRVLDVRHSQDSGILTGTLEHYLDAETGGKEGRASGNRPFDGRGKRFNLYKVNDSIEETTETVDGEEVTTTTHVPVVPYTPEDFKGVGIYDVAYARLKEEGQLLEGALDV